MTQFNIDPRLFFLDRILKNIFALSYSVAKIIFKSSLSKGFYYLVMTDELRRAKCMKIIAIFTSIQYIYHGIAFLQQSTVQFASFPSP